jgi:DoxX-like family
MRLPATPAGEAAMLAAYAAVTVAAAIAYAYAAVLNFTHNKSVAEVAERLRVPVSWMVRLGFLLAAGSIGLVAGFAVPVLGTAAACGLVLYFVSAAGAHIRARDTRLLNWVNWAVFFSLAVAALAVGLAYRGPW